MVLESRSDFCHSGLSTRTLAAHFVGRIPQQRKSTYSLHQAYCLSGMIEVNGAYLSPKNGFGLYSCGAAC